MLRANGPEDTETFVWPMSIRIRRLSMRMLRVLSNPEIIHVHGQCICPKDTKVCAWPVSVQSRRLSVHMVRVCLGPEIVRV